MNEYQDRKYEPQPWGMTQPKVVSPPDDYKDMWETVRPAPSPDDTAPGERAQFETTPLPSDYKGLLEGMPPWMFSLVALGLLVTFIAGVHLVCQAYLRGVRGWLLPAASGLVISLFLEGVVAAFLSCRMAARRRKALKMWVFVIFVVLGISVGIGGLPILLSELGSEDTAPTPAPTMAPTLTKEAPAPTEETPAAPTATPTPEAAPPPAVITYTIQAGDALSTIAAKFGVTVEQLVAANDDIADPNRIRVGQVLIIPSQ